MRRPACQVRRALPGEGRSLRVPDWAMDLMRQGSEGPGGGGGGGWHVGDGLRKANQTSCCRNPGVLSFTPATKLLTNRPTTTAKTNLAMFSSHRQAQLPKKELRSGRQGQGSSGWYCLLPPPRVWPQGPRLARPDMDELFQSVSLSMSDTPN